MILFSLVTRQWGMERNGIGVKRKRKKKKRVKGEYRKF